MTLDLIQAVEQENIDVIKQLLADDHTDINYIRRTKDGPNESNRTALYLAVEKENIEIIKLLLTKDNINVNIPYIPNKFFIKFQIISFDLIQNHII